MVWFTGQPRGPVPHQVYDLLSPIFVFACGLFVIAFIASVISIMYRLLVTSPRASASIDEGVANWSYEESNKQKVIGWQLATVHELGNLSPDILQEIIDKRSPLTGDIVSLKARIKDPSMSPKMKASFQQMLDRARLAGVTIYRREDEVADRKLLKQTRQEIDYILATK